MLAHLAQYLYLICSQKGSGEYALAHMCVSSFAEYDDRLMRRVQSRTRRLRSLAADTPSQTPLTPHHLYLRRSRLDGFERRQGSAQDAPGEGEDDGDGATAEAVQGRREPSFRSLVRFSLALSG